MKKIEEIDLRRYREYQELFPSGDIDALILDLNEKIADRLNQIIKIINQINSPHTSKKSKT